jgi:hypothetical protein
MRELVNRVRELRINIRNELAQMMGNNEKCEDPEACSGQGPPSHASP